MKNKKKFIGCVVILFSCTFFTGSTYAASSMNSCDLFKQTTHSEADERDYIRSLGTGVAMDNGLVIYKSNEEVDFPAWSECFIFKYKVDGMDEFEIAIPPHQLVDVNFSNPSEEDKVTEMYLRLKLRNLHGKVPLYTYSVVFP